MSACRPFPIILGAILRQDTPLGFYTVEFTPLYIGSATFFSDTTPPIGGGFVDPIGESTIVGPLPANGTARAIGWCT